MNILIVLIPLAMLLSAGFVAAFVWSARAGQWDDLDLAPRKMLREPNQRGVNNGTND